MSGGFARKLRYRLFCIGAMALITYVPLYLKNQWDFPRTRRARLSPSPKEAR